MSYSLYMSDLMLLWSLRLSDSIQIRLVSCVTEMFQVRIRESAIVTFTLKWLIQTWNQHVKLPSDKCKGVHMWKDLKITVIHLLFQYSLCTKEKKISLMNIIKNVLLGCEDVGLRNYWQEFLISHFLKGFKSCKKKKSLNVMSNCWFVLLSTKRKKGKKTDPKNTEVHE